MYNLLPSQRRFLHVELDNVKLDVALYQGGYGSGKSFIGSFAGLELARLYPNSRGLVGALTRQIIKDTTLESYFDHFDTLGWVDGKHYRWNKTEMILRFANGSVIFFKHLEDPRKLKSLNLDWAHIEEASELPYETLRQIIARLRNKVIPRKRLLLTSNPQSGRGWIYEVFVEKNKGPIVSESGEVIHYRRIIAPSTENVNLDESFLLAMRAQYDDEYYKINVLGQDGDYTMGLVIKDWCELNETTVEYDNTIPLYLGVDFNVDPMCWVLYHRYNGEYHFFDELCIESTTVQLAIEEFMLRYPVGNVREVIINGDSSGGNRNVLSAAANETAYTIMLNALNKGGYRVKLDVRSSNPLISDRVAAFNAMVCNTQGHRRVFANKTKCKQLVWNMRNLKYKEGTSEIMTPSYSDVKNNKQAKFIGHPFDAASYGVERYDPIKKYSPERKRLGDAPELVYEV